MTVRNGVAKALHAEETTNARDIDLTGRERMVGNVVSGWAAHFVIIAAGFVLPRIIDQQVGQTALGIWDLCWSVLRYTELVKMGTAGSVNRYVARHRARHDAASVRRAVSSIMCIQFIAAAVTFASIVVVAWSLPRLFAQRLGPDAETASSLMLLLGAAMAIRMAFSPFHGVITGCHRWRLHNALIAGSNGVTTLAMIAALSLGGQLRSLALVNLVGIAVTDIVCAGLAYRVCPELRVRPAYADWHQARRMLGFGAKNLLTAVSQLLLFETNKIFVATWGGVGALAVYSRPHALVRHLDGFTRKFAFVLAPTASALQGSGQHTELRELLIGTTRYAACLTLPIVLLLAILGDSILLVWMGPRYEQGVVLAILAVGHLLSLTQQPATSILTGLNLHGRVALANLTTALAGVGMAVITMGMLGWGVVGAALSIAVPLTLGSGVFVSFYACRRLDVPLAAYVKHAFSVPVACALPFALCLVAIRVLLGDRPLLAIVLACVAGVLVLGPLYMRYAIPGPLREKVLGAFPGGKFRWVGAVDV